VLGTLFYAFEFTVPRSCVHHYAFPFYRLPLLPFTVYRSPAAWFVRFRVRYIPQVPVYVLPYRYAVWALFWSHRSVLRIPFWNVRFSVLHVWSAWNCSLPFEYHAFVPSRWVPFVLLRCSLRYRFLRSCCSMIVLRYLPLPAIHCPLFYSVDKRYVGTVYIHRPSLIAIVLHVSIIFLLGTVPVLPTYRLHRYHSLPILRLSGRCPRYVTCDTFLFSAIRCGTTPHRWLYLPFTFHVLSIPDTYRSRIVSTLRWAFHAFCSAFVPLPPLPLFTLFTTVLTLIPIPTFLPVLFCVGAWLFVTPLPLLVGIPLFILTVHSNIHICSTWWCSCLFMPGFGVRCNVGLRSPGTLPLPTRCCAVPVDLPRFCHLTFHGR